MSAAAPDPIAQLAEWLEDAVRYSGLRYPRSFCLSTVDEHGQPDGRFVDLKEITPDGLVFGTHLESPKAAAMERDPRVSATFWWDALGRQVRVSGAASRVSDAVADRLFEGRPRDARLVSALSVQSRPLDDPAALESAVDEARRRPVGPERPATWGGYCIRPERVEFLRFTESRLHERLLFVRSGSKWAARYLQP